MLEPQQIRCFENLFLLLSLLVPSVTSVFGWGFILCVNGGTGEGVAVGV